MSDGESFEFASGNLKYGVICPSCGPVRLTNREYNRQMNNADAVWFCPKCRKNAKFDDELYDKSVADMNSEIEGYGDAYETGASGDDLEPA